ncbi:MAG: tRNA-intron lyase [Candidatus Marsarchaeota archaeon]|nr:tRNA-intron lyase [Candidatus Marsarchaeota archaeon]MCL5106392.1 tRNA-intron lyase [Candidatus Marsarchaeota archaeon]
MLQIFLDEKTKKIFATDQSTIDILKNGFFGEAEGGRILLAPEEALYMIDVRKAQCLSSESGKEVGFDEFAGLVLQRKKMMARYFTYKDWRDRGIMIKDFRFIKSGAKQSKAKVPIKSYPASGVKLNEYSLNGTFFPDDLICIVGGDEGKKIYLEHWFGQYGTYKLNERGILNKLDMYETLYLMEKKILAVKNFTREQISRAAEKRRHDFVKLYLVYRDWRDRGYVVKTGFKFGTHFRIYFPGARPVKDEQWMHSKHVIHVFPRDTKLLISEWARAIRVAHSVRKTFILAIPGKTRNKKMKIDFVLYHRKNKSIELPGADAPRLGMLSLGEDEVIGGSELSAMINEAKENKLELIIAISDRETAVTYYKVRRITLPKSEYEYYEIDWMQP